MEPRRAAAELSLPLAAVVLVVFLAGGVGAGALARGFVNSLGAAPTRAAATATATPVAQHATPTSGPPTTIPTQAGPDQLFVLQITATPSHVSAGATIKISVVATTESGQKPVAGLSCVLAAPRAGSSGLLSAWPAAQVTDAYGTTSWTLTVPSSQPAGTYGVEVSATGTNHHATWQDAFVYVG
jgi:hypothetical protein